MTAPEIQQEMERTRGRLGETVEELAAKADVKARAGEMKAKARGKAAEMKAKARGKAAEVKAKARGKAAEVSGQVRQNQTVQRRWPAAAAAAGAVIIGSILVWRRRKT